MSGVPYQLFYYDSNNTPQLVQETASDGTVTSGASIPFGQVQQGATSNPVKCCIAPISGQQINAASFPVFGTGTNGGELLVSTDNTTYGISGASVNISVTNPTGTNNFYLKTQASITDTVATGDTSVSVGIGLNPASVSLIPMLSAPVIAAVSNTSGQMTVTATTAAVSNIGDTVLYDVNDALTNSLLYGNVTATQITTGYTFSLPAGTYNVQAVAKDATNNLTAASNIVTGVAVAQSVISVSNVTISGGTDVGSSATVAYTLSASATSAAIQWLRNGAAISGAASATYTRALADVGNTLTVSIIPSDSSGTTGTLGTATAAATTLPAVTNVAAAAGNGNVALTWTASLLTGVTYNVYDSQTSTVTTTSTKAATGLATNSDTVPSLTSGTTYYFGVTQAYNGAESPMSNIASAKPYTSTALVNNTASLNGALSVLSTNIIAQGIKFTANTQLTSVQLYLAVSASTVATDMTLQLWVDGGGYPSGLFKTANTTVLPSSVGVGTANLALVSFDTSNFPSLTSNVEYWLVAVPTGTGSGSWYVGESSSSGASTILQGVLSSTDSGVSWNPVTGEDLFCIIIGYSI